MGDDFRAVFAILANDLFLFRSLSAAHRGLLPPSGFSFVPFLFSWATITHMPTPSAVEPPTPENVHLYRAAAIAYRNTWREELRRNDGNRKLANPHAPLHAAAIAVRKLAAEMSYQEAWTFGQRAVAWAGQVHHAWLSGKREMRIKAETLNRDADRGPEGGSAC